MKMTDIDIERYHELAQQKQKEHRKFLATLKKKLLKILIKSLKKFTQKFLTRLIVQNVLTAAKAWVLCLQKQILHAFQKSFA